jgi:RNA polymerase sigma-70 factor (ECF subfamily)
MQRLVEEVASGDASALATLYRALAPSVYGLALRITRDRSAADEVVVDTFWQVWRQASRYDGVRGEPIAWILTIARSRALDRLRSLRRSRSVEGIDVLETASSDESPETDLRLAERAAAVRAAFEFLPGGQRQALELAYFDGLSHTEIAARLGEPLGTVKTRIRSGLTRMREALGAMD